jgi:hypothetical protein
VAGEGERTEEGVAVDGDDDGVSGHGVTDYWFARKSLPSRRNSRQTDTRAQAHSHRLRRGVCTW